MIRTPVKVHYYSDILKETTLVESDQVCNELRLTTVGKFNDIKFITYKDLLDDRIETLYTDIDRLFVFQGDTNNLDQENKILYDYYTYIDNAKLITLFIEPGVNKVELVYSDGTIFKLPDEINNKLKDEIYLTCYKILLISVNESGDAKVLNKIHKISKRPHVNYYKDIMTKSEMDRIQMDPIYDNMYDIRNNHVLGSNLGGNDLW